MPGFVLGVFGLATGAILFVAPALANSSGDGSGASNPLLLKGSPVAQCAYWWQCAQPQPVKTKAPQRQPVPVVPSQKAPTPVALTHNCTGSISGSQTPEDCPVELAQTNAPPPASPGVQPPIAVDPVQTQSVVDQNTFPASTRTQRMFALEPDWNVGLRGGFENGSTGSRFVVYVSPSVSLRHGFDRGDMAISASSDIAVEQGGGARVANGNLTLNANYAIGRGTNLSGGAALSLSQDSAFAPDAAAGISAQPLVITGSANAAVSHEFGRGGLTARASLEREVYGPTQMLVGPDVDNSSRSGFTFGGGLRASYGVTRTTRVFVDGTIARNIYDAVSPVAGVKLDSWTYGLRGGLSLNFGRVVQAELAGGYGVRQYDSATLAATPAWLASAQISVRPEERLSFTGNVSTEFTIPDNGTSTSEIDYIAGLSARYRVTDQLGLRASLGGEWRDVIGAADGWQVNAGAGVDFAINKQTTLTGDYTYSTGQTGGAAPQDSHQISLGVRYGRAQFGVSTP